LDFVLHVNAASAGQAQRVQQCNLLRISWSRKQLITCGWHACAGASAAVHAADSVTSVVHKSILRCAVAPRGSDTSRCRLCCTALLPVLAAAGAAAALRVANPASASLQRSGLPAKPQILLRAQTVISCRSSWLMRIRYQPRPVGHLAVPAVAAECYHPSVCMYSTLTSFTIEQPTIFE
jgi:hypothetical protein